MEIHLNCAVVLIVLGETDVAAGCGWCKSVINEEA